MFSAVWGASDPIQAHGPYCSQLGPRPARPPAALSEGIADISKGYVIQ